jgi:hypothetical protein
MTTDRVAGVGLAVFAAVVLEESWRSRLPLGSVAMPGPAYMPSVLAAALLVFALVIVVQGAGAPRLVAVGWGEWRHAAAITGVCVFMALALERLGYRLTMGLACAFLLIVVERRRLVAGVLFAVGLALGTHFLFDTLLRVQLPRGPFGF